MNPEFIKLVGPAIIFLAFLNFAFREKKPLVIGAALFFASYASCSSNFIFVYRDVYQITQIALIIAFIAPALRSGRFFRVNLIFIILLMFVGISLIYVPFDEDANLQLINLLVSIGIVNYLFSAIRTSEDLQKVLHFFSIISVLLASIGLFEFVFIEQTRIETTFANSNYLGLFLGIGACVVLATWHGWKKNLASFVIISAIVLSGSRSALIFPVLQFIWIIYLGRKSRRFLPLVVVFISLAVFSVFSGVTRYSNEYETAGSDAERVIFAKIALRMAQDYPLTGIGWGRFISEFGRYSSTAERILTAKGVTDVSDQDRRVTHNDYLRILAELGVIAFVISIIFSIYGIKILIAESEFGFNYLLPIYFGLILFSIGHNNLNGGFFWFFFVLPFYLNCKFNGNLIKNVYKIENNKQ